MRRQILIYDTGMLKEWVPEYVPVAQLDRASDSDSEGRAFESHRAYQKNTTPRGGVLLLAALRRGD